MPVLFLLLLVSFPFLSKLDPKKENYKKFEQTRELMQTVLLLFFAYAYFLSLYAIQFPDVNIGKFLLIGIGILFAILGNYMGKIKQNYFIGIKVPWTLNDEDIWNKTSRFGGKAFVFGGILFVVIGIFSRYALRNVLSIIAGIVLLPILYSYLLFFKKKK